MTIKNIYIYAIVILFPPVLGWYIIGADEWDLTIPLVYGMHDDIWQLTLTKALIDNGWVLHNEYLGAPSVANWHYHAAAQTSAIHSIIMKMMSLLVDNPVKVQQYYYFLNFSFISLSAYLAARLLKVNELFSIAIALVFSLITFRFNTISMAFLVNYFMIPWVVVVVVWSSLGVFTQSDNGSVKKSIFIKVKEVMTSRRFLFSCIIIFFMSIADGYYAFFTILLLGFSSILVYFNRENNGLIASCVPIFFVLMIIGINTIMMFPLENYKEANYSEFNPNGVPDSSLNKSPMEAEVYSSSLKLMLAPIINHRITAIADFGKKIVETSDAARKFPVTQPFVSLGTLGSICLLFTLMFLIAEKLSVAKDSLLSSYEVFKRVRVFALLSLFIVLSSVSGGIGTLIALVFPTIRAYDRFPLFLIFVVLVAVAFWLTFKLSQKQQTSIQAVILTSFVIIFAIWDQSPSTALKSVSMPHVKRFIAERTFIEHIESTLNTKAMVYQYPFSQYLTDNKYYGWGAFAQMRSYLHSKNLRWSNGASKNSKVDIWHAELADLPFDELVSQLLLYGFEGVLIDRLVVTDEEFENIKNTVGLIYNIEIEVNEDAKLAFFKLPKIGFRLHSGDDFTRPVGIEIIESETLDFSKLPNYIDQAALNIIINNIDNMNRVYDFKTHPELFDFQAYSMQSGNKLNFSIDKNLLRGSVICHRREISKSETENGILHINIQNNSDVDWRLNSGRMPLSIGYHLYDSDNHLIAWDNGYRFKSRVFIGAGKDENIKIRMSDLGLDNTSVGNYSLVFELLQESNAWFGVNPDNKTCHIQVVGK